MSLKEGFGGNWKIDKIQMFFIANSDKSRSEAFEHLTFLNHKVQAFSWRGKIDISYPYDFSNLKSSAFGWKVKYKNMIIWLMNVFCLSSFVISGNQTSELSVSSEI